MKMEVPMLESLNLLTEEDGPEMINQTETAISEFLDQWLRVDDALYNHSLQSTQIRRAASISVSKEAQQTFYWFYTKSQQACELYKRDPFHSKYGKKLQGMAEEFESQCLGELRHVTEILTPVYKVLKPSGNRR
jgi:hypothetical protein